MRKVKEQVSPLVSAMTLRTAIFPSSSVSFVYPVSMSEANSACDVPETATDLRKSPAKKAV